MAGLNILIIVYISKKKIRQILWYNLPNQKLFEKISLRKKKTLVMGKAMQ